MFYFAALIVICCDKVLKHNQAPRPITWSEADDQKLTDAVMLFQGEGRGGTVDWVKVCDYMADGRTREQHSGRWNGVLKHREKGTGGDSGERPEGVSILLEPSSVAEEEADAALGVRGEVSTHSISSTGDVYQI